MKKFYIVLFNIIVLVFIYFGFEYCLYLKSDDEKPFFYSVKSIKSQDWDEFYKTAHFKEPIFRNKDLKPIVLFGCSFAFGFGIDDEQTFSYKLSKYTNRTVYNRGLCGGGIQHVLYQLRREDFYKEIPEPEYVIYLYISNHIRRMYKYAYNDVVLGGEYNYLKYNKIFDELKQEHRIQNMLYSRVWNRLILYNIAYFSEKNQTNAFNLFEKHLLDCKKEMRKHWKNTKFIILDYEAEDKYFNMFPDFLNRNNVNTLIKDGFIVIKTSDLTNIKLGKGYYTSVEDQHPNEKAWDLITPLFVEKLKDEIVNCPEN